MSALAVPALPPTLYYHFRSKDDLIAAALEVHAELALARIRKWGVTMPEDLGSAIDGLFDGRRGGRADPDTSAEASPAL